MSLQVAVICALVAVACAGGLGHIGGHSVGSRKQDDFGNYAFNYQIVDGLGATNGRWEAGNGKAGKVVGSYNLADIDGRARRVDYVADGHGFRAQVKTNEPGTQASLPAAAVIASPYKGTVVAGPVAGPALAKVAVAAPVAVGIGHGGYGLGGYGGFGGHGGLVGGYGHGGYGGFGHGGGYGGYGFGGHGGYHG